MEVKDEIESLQIIRIVTGFCSCILMCQSSFCIDPVSQWKHSCSAGGLRSNVQLLLTSKSAGGTQQTLMHFTWPRSTFPFTGSIVNPFFWSCDRLSKENSTPYNKHNTPPSQTVQFLYTWLPFIHTYLAQMLYGALLFAKLLCLPFLLCEIFFTFFDAAWVVCITPTFSSVTAGCRPSSPSLCSRSRRMDFTDFCSSKEIWMK